MNTLLVFLAGGLYQLVVLVAIAAWRGRKRRAALPVPMPAQVPLPAPIPRSCTCPTCAMFTAFTEGKLAAARGRPIFIQSGDRA